MYALVSWITRAITLCCLLHWSCQQLHHMRKLLVQRKYSVTDRLMADQDYVSPMCYKTVRPIDGRWLKWMLTALCLVWRPLSAMWVACCVPVGGCGHDIANRICMDWRKLTGTVALPPTTNALSPKERSKVYITCAHPTMIHGSITWGTNTCDLQQRHHYDHWMMH